MNLFNRLLAIGLAFALVLAGLFALPASLGWLPHSVLGEAPWLQSPAAALAALDGMARFGAAAGAAAGILCGTGLLILESHGSAGTRELVIHRDGFGRVSVSIEGLRRLADHVISEIEGVEQVRSAVRPTRKGLAFDCRVQVRPDGSTPLLADEIRSRLGDALSNHIGQSAHRIHVHTRVGGPALVRHRVR